jgi:hypothetical protein
MSCDCLTAMQTTWETQEGRCFFCQTPLREVFSVVEGERQYLLCPTCAEALGVIPN